ncbi:hypothetical protein FB45DRAFT_389535 [Roridomyces roridus]|uniref:F-box domain-containing protein n=1 Tax=Roridomyces roridus TaxID=1738132 RepID=A0AAD7B1X0_9AGAR|nr:hypothetical protein FB45DRAFT_389535 [Roridomyces roridus]
MASASISLPLTTMVLTRRAHRARLRITLWLPNEVLANIIQCATQSGQATLCRLSKLFHALVLPILNRHIKLNLSNPERSYHSVLENLSRSFIENPQRAETVRSVVFVRRKECYFAVNFVLLFEAMELMRSLEHLFFYDWHEPAIATRLACLEFPNLSWFRMIGDFSSSDPSDFVKFFIRHPSITRLRLLSRGLAHGGKILDHGQGILPNLQQFDGTQLLFHRFATQHLRAVRYGPWDQLTASDVETLKERTDHTLPFVLSLDLKDGVLDAVGENILSPLSRGMPDIQSLQLQTPKKIDLSCMGALKRIGTHLALFRCIAYFAVAHWGEPVDIQSVEAVFQTWVAACSTLKGCSIAQFAQRKVGEKWEQCSTDDFDDEGGFRELDG